MDTEKNPCGFASLKEAAAFFGVSTRTIYRMISEKAIRAYRIGSKTIRIPREDLDRYLEENQVELRTPTVMPGKFVYHKGDKLV